MVSPEVARFLGRLFLADFGEAGGDTLLWDSEDLPEETAESLSESSDFTAVLVFTETYKMFFKKSILAINGLNSILQKKKNISYSHCYGCCCFYFQLRPAPASIFQYY